MTSPSIRSNVASSTTVGTTMSSPAFSAEGSSISPPRSVACAPSSSVKPSSKGLSQPLL